MTFCWILQFPYQLLQFYDFLSPPLWTRRLHARLSRSGPGFDPRSGQVSWVRFFRGFSSLVRQMSGSSRPPRSPNIIWPSLSSIIIHYGRQWPEMLTRPKNHKYTYVPVRDSWRENFFTRAMKRFSGHWINWSATSREWNARSRGSRERFPGSLV